MPRMSVIIAALVMVLFSGCNQPTKPNWELITPFVQAAAQQGATIAFAQPSVSLHKEEICVAVTQVADVLEQFNDPNATFDLLRQKMLAELDKITLPEPTKQIVVSVVDSVVSVAFACVKTNYSDLINTDQAQAVLIISKATAAGLQSACQTKVMFIGETPSFLFPK